MRCHRINCNLFKVNSLTHNDIIAQYSDLFDGQLGLMQRDVHLELDPEVQPVQLPLRRLPIAVRDRVEQELKRMTAEGIITPVNEPTPWVSALVVTMKANGQLRICMDPTRTLNKALIRSTYYMPTLDDILPKLSNVKVFSTVDCQSAFHMLKLDFKSSMLCTFETPFGRHRYLRLPYGLSVSPEIFQQRIHAALSGLNGIYCIADDILITGSGDDTASATSDHDRNLTALLQRCRQAGIKLNKAKLKLHRDVITFMGHDLTKDGVRPSASKVEAIVDFKQPDDKAAVQRLLGMTAYLARYCPRYSETTSVLRELIKQDNEFRWDHRHTTAMNAIKDMLTSAPVLQYFNQSKQLLIQCDSSQNGLGAALMQDNHIIEYASRALSATEQGYAQIEKELLAVVFAMERWHTYTFGRSVIVETDHKPLLPIFKKGLISAPKRVQRMLRRLQTYTFEARFKPGRELVIADTLSRAYTQTATETTFPEEIAALVMADAEQTAELSMVASAATVKLILNAAARDHHYQQLEQQIRRGWPESTDDVPQALRPYVTFTDELTISRGLIFKGSRLVVPESARNDILKRIHSAHIGVNGCIRRAKDAVFWPGMTAEVKRYAEACSICNRYRDSNRKEPLMPHASPSRPWQKVGVDIFTHTGRDYLATVDYLSGYTEVDRLPTKTVADIVYCLKQQFARHGIPEEVVTDNSPFNSAEFRNFAFGYEFLHTTSSPIYAQSNGRVENAIKTLKRLMTRAREEHADPFLALLEWRNTPSEQLGPSPVQIMFGRRTRTRLPSSNQLLDTPLSSPVQQALNRAKLRQAYYYNRNAKERTPLSVGQPVRIKHSNDEPDWRPAEIVDVLPYRSYKVRMEDGSTRRRTSRHLRESLERPTVIEEDSPPSSPDSVTTAPTTAETGNETTKSSSSTGDNQPPGDTSAIKTRYGRTVKRPVRYSQ